MGCIAATLPPVHPARRGRGTSECRAGATFCRRGARPSRRSAAHADSKAPRTVREWLTNFHLLLVAVDPYTSESAWVLDTGARIMACSPRPTAVWPGSWPATPRAPGLPRAVEPEFLTFMDPDRAAIKATRIERLPALVWSKTDLTIGGAPKGGTPPSGGPWRQPRRGHEPEGPADPRAHATRPVRGHTARPAELFRRIRPWSWP